MTVEGHAVSISTGAGAAAGLAYTGLNAIAYIVAALTLIFTGLALLKLMPRRTR
jgi:amino acid transporter